MLREGWWKNGKPDVSGFALKHAYITSYLYRWLKGDRVPDLEYTVKLAHDLKADLMWLICGHPTAVTLVTGGGTAAAPVPSENPDQGPRVGIMSTPPRKPLAPVRRLAPTARAVAR